MDESEVMIVRGPNMQVLPMNMLTYYATRPVETDAVLIGPGGTFPVEKGMTLGWELINLVLGNGWDTPEREESLRDMQQVFGESGIGPDTLEDNEARCKRCGRGYDVWALDDGICDNCRLGINR